MSESAAAAASGAESAGRSQKARGGEPQRRGLLARLVLFVRQVVGELKKVVRPTRQELVTYTAVVLVFVVIVMAFVGVIDFGFGRLVLWVFGG